MPRLWITDAQVDGRRITCLVENGRVAALQPGLQPPPGDRAALDARGGALLPGLIDHHIHLFALAAARASLDLSGVTDLAAVPQPPGIGWLRATGAGRTWTRAELDARFGDRPVRVQHRSGALWTLSSAAVDAVADGLTAEERATGQLWRADNRLRALLTAAGAGAAPDVAGLGAWLAAAGITRVTDATPGLDETGLALLRTQLRQHVESLSDSADAALPVKIVVPDHDLPSLDGVVAAVRDAREQGRAVAVHAVTAVALALAIAALDVVGTQPGDRVEHAALCDSAAAARLAELEITVVTQPSLWRRRGAEFHAETPAPERPWLWRYGSLLRAGVRVAVSSDAPYGDADPWVTVHAAATRDEPERVTPAEALRTLLTDATDPAGQARPVAVGAPADLIVLDAPLAAVLARLERSPSSPVLATIVGDEILTVTAPEGDR